MLPPYPAPMVRAGIDTISTLCRAIPQDLETFSSLSRTISEPRKLEHGFRRTSARIPYTLP